MKKKIIINICLCLILLPSLISAVGLQPSLAQEIHRTEPIPIDEIFSQINEAILLKYLENLTAFGPRMTGTQACSDAADYIYQQFESMGLEVCYQTWSDEGYTASNIEATLYSHYPTSDPISIICAHYDSVPGSPGADDDGSGVALVLAAAEILSQYSTNSIARFVVFSGEEEGLLGSHAYVEEALEQGDNIAAVINIDMIGYAVSAVDGETIKVYSNPKAQWLKQLFISISETYDSIDLTVTSTGVPGGSDHLSFWDAGYTAAFAHEFHLNPYMHTSEDTIEHMNLTSAVKCSKLILATFAELVEPSPSSEVMWTAIPIMAKP